MKKLLTLSLFFVIFYKGILINVYANPDQSNNSEPEMTEYKHYFVQLVGTRDDWPDNMTEKEEKIMQEHFVYLKDLVAKKRVLLAGPCFEPVFGLIILQTTTKEEAIEIMNNEPSVVQEVHTYEMHPMNASLMAHNLPSTRYVSDPTDKALNLEIIVKASLDD